MISIDQYLKDRYEYDFRISDEKRAFQKKNTLSGLELVPEAHRLALMNAKLHNLDSQIHLNDTLSEMGKSFNEYNGVLANPPFETKKGGKLLSRDDFTFPISNKQLNFLQHIYRSLRKNGKAKAAAILPDNVLFEDGEGITRRMGSRLTRICTG